MSKHKTHTWRENWPRTFQKCYGKHTRTHMQRHTGIRILLQELNSPKRMNERTSEWINDHKQRMTEFEMRVLSHRPFFLMAKQTLSPLAHLALGSALILYTLRWVCCFLFSLSPIPFFVLFMWLMGLLLIRIWDRMVALFSFNINPIFSFDDNSFYRINMYRFRFYSNCEPILLCCWLNEWALQIQYIGIYSMA